MEQRVPAGLAHHIRNLAGLARASSQSDAELLTAFVERSDGEAFAALVLRHGQAVWAACRQVLDSDADAADAFQATFIALARKAAALRRESLAGWLRKVAHEVALDAYKAAKRRNDAHRRLCEHATARTANPPPTEEVWAAVREELAGLPARFRLPLTFFYLDGRTQVETAELLGIAERSVRDRLAKGLAVLRERLARRGMAVTTAVLVALLGNVPTLSAIPTSLAAITATSALAIARGETVATPAAQLADHVVCGARWSSSKKLWAMLVIALGLGVGVAGWQALASLRTETPPQVHAQGPAMSFTPIAAPIPAGPVVSGEVMDADGKSIPNADVAVFLSRPPSGSNPTGADRVVGVGRADKKGEFRIVLPLDTPTKPLLVLAAAPKKAVNAVTVDPDALKSVRVTLADAEPISGTVVVPKGQSPAGARVRVWRIGPIWIGPSLEADKDPAPPVPFWPAATITDAKGEFTLTGLTRTTSVLVEVVHPDYARADARHLGKDAALTVELSLPKTVTGRVVAGNPPKPVARAMVGYPLRLSRGAGTPNPLVIRQTGPDGTFKLSVPRIDDVLLWAGPPAGSKLQQVIEQVELDGREGNEVELALPAVKR